MVDADSDTKGGLPVTSQLVTTKIKVPVSNAIELAEHTFIAELMDSTFCLLGSGQFPEITEHIDSGEIKGAVGAHGLTECCRLRSQSWFFHHVAGESNSVAAAPGPHIVGESVSKTFADMIVVVIAVCGYLTVGKLPDTFWEGIKEIRTVSILIGVVEIIRIRQDYFLFSICKTKGGFMAELRFICKD